MAKGQVLRVIDPEGEQVSDVTAFAAEDTREWLSAGRTIDYAETVLVTTGDVLYSDRSRAMFTIVEDTCGRHDLLLAPCSLETFRIIHKVEGYHPSCLDNLATGLEEFGIGKDAITDTLNVFMRVEVAPNGKVSVEAPTSKAGDHTDLRAEMDLVVGVTACSSPLTNAGRCKPIVIEMWEGNNE